VAHAPDEVGDRYPGVDRQLLRDCRTLVLALITVWRFDRDDQFPDGRRLGVTWLNHLRTVAPASAQPGARTQNSLPSGSASTTHGTSP
jgi:hypothetical protein